MSLCCCHQKQLLRKKSANCCYYVHMRRLLFVHMSAYALVSRANAPLTEVRVGFETR